MAQARIQNDVDLLREFKQVAMDVLGVKRRSSYLLHNLSFFANFIDDQSNIRPDIKRSKTQ